jgi:hypothetical protein
LIWFVSLWSKSLASQVDRFAWITFHFLEVVSSQAFLSGYLSVEVRLDSFSVLLIVPFLSLIDSGLSGSLLLLSFWFRFYSTWLLPSSFPLGFVRSSALRFLRID